MKEQVLELFREYAHVAILLSILISMLVAVLGVVPSFFITAANILFFGFWPGFALSLAGEALGAALAFFLYRKGFRKMSVKPLEKFPKARRLVELEGRPAFFMILSLRLLPFVPSGLVTFAAAVGKVSAPVFLLASTLGKIPALFIEAYSLAQVAKFGWQGKLILFAVACYLIWIVVKSTRKN
ncbi:MAG TPA: VTT domain-containing protein [Flavisolibacter sp.]